MMRRPKKRDMSSYNRATLKLFMRNEFCVRTRKRCAYAELKWRQEQGR